MTAMALLDLVDDGGADIAAIHDGPAVVDLLRAAAGAGPNQVWTLAAGPLDRTETPSLTVGVSEDGQHGWLSWWDGHQSWQPDFATRTGHLIDYWCVDQHMQIDAGQHLPVDLVFEALREYLNVHERPKAVGWTRGA